MNWLHSGNGRYLYFLIGIIYLEYFLEFSHNTQISPVRMKIIKRSNFSLIISWLFRRKSTKLWAHKLAYMIMIAKINRFHICVIRSWVAGVHVNLTERIRHELTWTKWTHTHTQTDTYTQFSLCAAQSSVIFSDWLIDRNN